jgi:hypothetical protein
MIRLTSCVRRPYLSLLQGIEEDLKLLKQLLQFLGIGTAGEENGTVRDPTEALKRVYYAQLRLAEQIRGHAQAAPYPQTAESLRRVADKKFVICETLKETLMKLGSYVEAKPALAIKSGRNHWERMAQDVNDQAMFERMLQEFSGLLTHEAAEIGELLGRVLNSETVNREALIGLLMRADPQANQT